MYDNIKFKTDTETAKGNETQDFETGSPHFILIR